MVSVEEGSRPKTANGGTDTTLRDGHAGAEGRWLGRSECGDGDGPCVLLVGSLAEGRCACQISLGMFGVIL